MKKSISILILMIFTLFVASNLFATKIEEADVYYVNVKILKVFSHPKGFYIIYQRAGVKNGEVFIPHSWFNPKDGRATAQRVNTRVAPYLSFFIKEGKFDLVKVSLPESIHHPIWGILRSPAKYNSRFENIETLELKF